MKAGRFTSWVVVLASLLFLSGCLLPGMIPLNPTPEGPLPVMETDPEALLAKIQAGDWVYLESLAEEAYSDEDYAGPGTLTYTIKITDDTPTYFGYGWCTTTQEILQQNFEHIRVRLSINGRELDKNAVHPLSFARPDGFVCLSLGTLLSDWQPGEYELEAAATFEEEINDGAADFEAGDYVFVYNVSVDE
jgi:hypothetical protein